jgi:cell division protein FtsB
MNRFILLIKNKYFLASLAFLIWMLFFDRNDLLSQYEYQSQLNKLQEEKEFYQKETELVKKDLEELTTDMKKLEKFAREKYLMKKDDEDVFVIVKEEKEEKKSFF